MKIISKFKDFYDHKVAKYAKQQHSGLYQVERGNPKRVFEGPGFRERYA